MILGVADFWDVALTVAKEAIPRLIVVFKFIIVIILTTVYTESHGVALFLIFRRSCVNSLTISGLSFARFVVSPISDLML